MLTQKTVDRMIAAGYTHLVSYERYSSFCESWVENYFPTTDDAVQVHRDAMYSTDDHVRSIQIRKLSEIYKLQRAPILAKLTEMLDEYLREAHEHEDVETLRNTSLDDRIKDFILYFKAD